MTLKSINPATEELIAEYPENDDEEIKRKIYLSSEAFKAWSITESPQRFNLMEKLINVLTERKQTLAATITQETGKPISQSGAEIEKCIMATRYYIDNASDFLKSKTVDTDASESQVVYEPLGVILGVMPWNFPFWQVLRFAIPTIIGGNVVLLKHASNVPKCALELEKIFSNAGFPQGVFQSLLITASKVEQVLRDPRVKGVSLTGSAKAGASLASIAGSEIKKSVLELGGSDPFIVLDDADIETASKQAADSRLRNAGQSCNAAKRFIVAESVADEFLARIKIFFSQYKPGDPNLPETNFGPLTTVQLLADIETQVSVSVSMGAHILLGGKRVQTKGYFYEPTILTNVTTEMPVWEEEVFGPVAPVYIVSNIEEAITCANNSIYGLCASIWTKDIEKARNITRQLEVGSVFINKMASSHPALPYGGVKKSGFGRELSEYGVKEFLNVKTMWIE